MTEKGRNPYAPPTAPVADVLPSRTAEMPGEVLAAIRLIWVSVLLGGVSALLGIPNLEAGSLVMALAIGGFGLLVVAVLNLVMSGGHHWARVVFVVLFFSGFLLGIPRIQLLWEAPSLRLAAQALQDVLQLIAVVLLLTGPANRWFKR